MKRLKFQPGLTLIEILVAVAILAVLTSVSLRLATRIEDQGKERLTRATIGILNTALQQFADYEYRYPNPAYQIFDFPVDCNEFYYAAVPSPSILQPTIEDVMSEPHLGRAAQLTSLNGSLRKQDRGCAGMWFFLSQVPQCRQTLDKISDSLIKTADANNVSLECTILFGGTVEKTYPLIRVVDPWGTTIHYDYYDELIIPNAANQPFQGWNDPQAMRLLELSRKTFPVITSAGRDKLLGTGDDIRIEKTP